MRQNACARRPTSRWRGPTACGDRRGLTRFPITAYDQLTTRQIIDRLPELSKADLRKVRDYEIGNRERKGILRALNRKLS